MTHDTFVLTHGAVVSQNRDLVGIGSYVQMNDEVSMFTEYISPFSCTYVSLASYVFRSSMDTYLPVSRWLQHRKSLQWLSPVCDTDGHQVNNACDSPLFSLSCVFVVLLSLKVCTSVSFVHECTNTCALSKDVVSVEVERGAVPTIRLVFHHHYSNKVFCLNLFCMNQ